VWLRLFYFTCVILLLAALARRLRKKQPSPPVSAGSTSFQTFGNAFNGVVGSGLLGIPYAIAVLGMRWGLVAVIVVGIVAGFTALQLSGLAGVDEKRTVEGYVELADRAFGKWGKRLTSVVLYTELLGVTGIFLVLAGRAFAALQLVNISLRGQALLAAGVTLPSLAVRDFKALSRLSFLGVAALTVCVFAVLSDALATDYAALDDSIERTFSANDKLSAVGLIIFAYACHGQFPALRASMAKPQEFPVVIFATFAAAAGVNACFGIGAAWGYGLSNVPEFVLEAMTAGRARKICLVMVLINTLMKIPLPIFAAALVLENKGVHYFAARATVLAAGAVLAVGVPGFARLMGLVGLITASALVFILPPLLELHLVKGKLQRHRQFANILIITAGSIFAIAGRSWASRHACRESVLRVLQPQKHSAGGTAILILMASVS